MAVDMFLKLGDLKGESQVRGFENQIQLLSWEWGMTQTGTMHQGSGGGAGRVNVQDLTFEHYLDAATPSLVAACCTGAHFPEATLTLRKAGGSALDYYIIKLTDIIVSAVSAEDNPGDELVREWVGLNFAAFEVTYQPQDQKGAKRGGAIVKQYDIAKDSGSYFSPPRAAAVVNGEAQLEEQYKKGNEAFDYVICASTTGRGNDEVLRHTVFGIEMSRVVLHPNGAIDFRITRNRIGLDAAIRSGLWGCGPPPSDALKAFLQKVIAQSIQQSGPQTQNPTLDEIVVTARRTGRLAGVKIDFNLRYPIEQLWIVTLDGSILYVPTKAEMYKDSCGNTLGKNTPDGSVPIPDTSDISALIHTHPSWGYAWPAAGDYTSAQNFSVYNINPTSAWVLRQGAARGSRPVTLSGRAPSPPPQGREATCR